MNICFASHNEHKVQEMNQIMPKGTHLVSLDSLGITEDIAETGRTLEENAKIKANYVFKRTKMPVFADDSGLLVNALEGAPGVYSARYAGPERSDEKNMDLLLDKLAGHTDRSAMFRTVIAFIDAAGQEKQFDGEIQGTIGSEKRGQNGFGYDPIFIPDGCGQTFAELTDEVKNSISHRAVAVKKLIDFLRQNHG